QRSSSTQPTARRPGMSLLSKTRRAAGTFTPKRRGGSASRRWRLSGRVSSHRARIARNLVSTAGTTRAFHTPMFKYKAHEHAVSECGLLLDGNEVAIDV